MTIREHVEEWCVDLDKISIIGFSTGAHLCGMYATTWSEPLLAESFGVDSSVFKPLSAMLIYGFLDYTIQEKFRKANPHPMIPPNLNEPTFGCVDPDEEQLKKYSPIYHISRDTPPIFMAAAIDDGLVPAIHYIKMAEKLQNEGLPYEPHMFQYGDHGFSLAET